MHSRPKFIFGAITTCVLSYGAWCGRSFYIKPSEFDGDLKSIPDHVMQTVRNWNSEQKLFGTPPFDWSEFVWLLRHPLESDPEPIWMSVNGGYHAISHPGAKRYPQVTQLMVSENWKEGHQMEVQHKMLGNISMVEFERQLNTTTKQAEQDEPLKP